MTQPGITPVTDGQIEQYTSYPDEHRRSRPIAEQVARLRELFRELKDVTYDETIAQRPIPPGSEGWFAIPRWEVLNGNYGEAVDRILDVLASTRTFTNYLKGCTSATHLRQHKRTRQMFLKLVEQQAGHDILIIPCQFPYQYGWLRHRRELALCDQGLMEESETVIKFGLGIFHVGCMLLTHPDREVRWKQLHINCIGDEFVPVAGIVRPYFYWCDGMLNIVAYGVGLQDEFFDSASAVLPK